MGLIIGESKKVTVLEIGDIIHFNLKNGTVMFLKSNGAKVYTENAGGMTDDQMIVPVKNSDDVLLIVILLAHASGFKFEEVRKEKELVVYRFI